MDNWRDWIPEPDRAKLDQYESQGLVFSWLELPTGQPPFNRRTLRVHQNGELIAQSDPIRPENPQQETAGLVRQTLVRLRTALRQQSAK
jgi:hypothetical protein